MKAKAYYSDPEHCNSFIGRWVWLYRGDGVLELNGDRLTYVSGPFNALELTRTQVRSIAVGSFPRSAKPIRLSFIDVCFTGADGKERNIYLVPLLPGKPAWRIPVWKTNDYVTKWSDALSEWHAEHQNAELSPAAVASDEA